MRRSLLKKYRRELNDLQTANLAFYGGDKAKEKQDKLILQIESLMPEFEDNQEQRWRSNWSILEAKGGQ